MPNRPSPYPIAQDSWPERTRAIGFLPFRTSAAQRRVPTAVLALNCRGRVLHAAPTFCRKTSCWRPAPAVSVLLFTFYQRSACRYEMTRMQVQVGPVRCGKVRGAPR